MKVGYVLFFFFDYLCQYLFLTIKKIGEEKRKQGGRVA